MEHPSDAILSASHNKSSIRSSGQARDHPIVVKPLYYFSRIDVPHSYARLGRTNDVIVIWRQSKTAGSFVDHLQSVQAVQISTVPHIYKRVFARGENKFVVLCDYDLVDSLLVPSKIGFQRSASRD